MENTDWYGEASKESRLRNLEKKASQFDDAIRLTVETMENVHSETVARLTREIDRLRAVLQEIVSKAHCQAGADNRECRLGLDDPNEWCLWHIAKRGLEGEK